MTNRQQSQPIQKAPELKLRGFYMGARTQNLAESDGPGVRFEVEIQRHTALKDLRGSPA